jgi:hypothetical protein
MLNCEEDHFPFTYLGLPVSDLALTVVDWVPSTARVAKRTDPWMGKSMSVAARLILTNTCLPNMPMNAMGLNLMGEGFYRMAGENRSRFYWEANGPKCKYH